MPVSLTSVLTQTVLSAILFVCVIVLYLRRFAPAGRWVAVAAGVCLLDQVTKALVSPGGQGRDLAILGGWLRITYLENPGQGFGGTSSFLLLLTAVCVFALFYLYRRLSKTRYRMSFLAEFACALMIGGYMGILLDRIRLGYVVDFLEFGWADAFVYNVADLAVLLAVALLVARSLRYLAQVKAQKIGLHDEVLP